MNRPKTRRTTLYRLPGITPTQDGMLNDFTNAVKDLDERHAEPTPMEVGGQPAVWIGRQGDTSKAEWCVPAAITTGLDLSYTECRSGGVLLVAVDGIVYGLSYGNGHLLIPDGLKDQRFGLRFLVRRLNPDQVRELVRRRPEARGRTDSTLVPGGAPVWMLGIAESVDIIRRIGGSVSGLAVTFASRDNRPIMAEGAVGLQMRFGVEPEALIADIREVERVCREEQPDPGLAFIDWVQPIADPATEDLLDHSLDDILGRADADDHVIPVVPIVALDHFAQAGSITVKIGRDIAGPFQSLDPRILLSRTRELPAGQRVTALRKGQVALYADDAADERLVGVAAIKWLEAIVPQQEHRFFLMDGDWYQIGEEYVRASRDEISRLFPATPSLDLPAWDRTRHRKEGDYNRHVPTELPGYLCLDANQRIRNPLGQRSPLEICDLLGPGNEHIHVKHAEQSGPLSHLFWQGLVSAQSLISGPDQVRKQFLETVAGLPDGRTLTDIRPKKVVFAILLKDGKQLTPDTLFPFSQVTLAHVARTLSTYGIDVEVIGIRGV